MPRSANKYQFNTWGMGYVVKLDISDMAMNILRTQILWWHLANLKENSDKFSLRKIGIFKTHKTKEKSKMSWLHAKIFIEFI
jgi:hypothetical protein